MTQGGNYCYYVSQSDRQTWFSARQKCKSLSGDLAKIHNEEIRMTLRERYLTGSKYWIGLVGLVWYWANGTAFNDSQYSWYCVGGLTSYDI